ncbi:MAG TPA: RagB/SusD family nutrient uptake outer membrane protein [Paludibacter sp.]|nr:RagB/SusD family nutrient uptake outer membrane protein [Paludibacter sp.]
MKKFKLNILIAGALTLGIFSSCSDSFLNSVPKSQLLDENFYKTEADAEMALVGCYDGYQLTSSGFPIYMVAEVASDECFGGTGANDGRGYQMIDRLDKSQSPADNNVFNDTWSKYYKAIFRCNNLLQKLPTISSWKSTDTTVVAKTKKRIEGETRFLRALMYFDLVRLFENVPLLTSPSVDNIPQANPSDVYKLIASDLKFAATNIPANAYPKAQAATNDGRVTRYAAEALLARVYLFYTGYYAKDDLGVTKPEVLAGLEDVVASKEFDTIPYKTLWPAASYIPVPATNTLNKSGYAGKGNKEVVFAQKFNSTSDYSGNVDGNGWLVMMGMRGTNFSPYGKGWGGCTVNPQLVNAYLAGDKRKTASVIDLVGEKDKDGKTIESFFNIPDQREYTGFTVKKYSPTALPDGTSDTGGSKDFQSSQDQDYIQIRYADVLLMAAELGSPNAVAYFNQVHQRAGLTAVASVSLSDIQTERRFEFAFEGIRYWDLLRTGLDNAANAIAASAQTVKSAGIDDHVTYNVNTIKLTKGFMQIPNTQITLSGGVLKQNQGW